MNQARGITARGRVLPGTKQRHEPSDAGQRGGYRSQAGSNPSTKPPRRRAGCPAPRSLSRWAPSAAASRLRVVVDGPFSETKTKELVAGIWLWQVKDLDEALEWARRWPDPMPGEAAQLEIRRVRNGGLAEVDPTALFESRGTSCAGRSRAARSNLTRGGPRRPPAGRRIFEFEACGDRRVPSSKTASSRRSDGRHEQPTVPRSARRRKLTERLVLGASIRLTVSLSGPDCYECSGSAYTSAPEPRMIRIGFGTLYARQQASGR